VLNKPFAEVSDALGLGYHFTQKGMRRTFNDLARAAKVEALVTRSIDGHLTERMQHHYSTVPKRSGRASPASLPSSTPRTTRGTPVARPPRSGSSTEPRPGVSAAVLPVVPQPSNAVHKSKKPARSRLFICFW
jgi:hypothetical protein